MFTSDGMSSPWLKAVISGNSIELNNRFNQEITQFFYKQAPLVSISVFIVVMITYYFLSPVVPETILVTWLSINVFFAITLLLTYFAYLRYSDSQTPRFWLNSYILLLVLQDVSLGMLGPMSIHVSDDSHRFLILFLLAGMAAGAMATRGILFKTYLTSASVLLLPVAITYSLLDYALANIMLELTLIFYIFMIFTGKNYSDTISNNIKLWLNLEQEIDARKKIETHLVRAKEEAEVANETKNQFLANVSHELRTPLNGIIGFSSALSKYKFSPAQENYIEQIGRCSRSLLSMVNDVLNLSTIEAGKLELHEYPFELYDEMDEVVELAQRLSEDKGLLFEYYVDTTLPQHLVGDGQRVKQVINNLISNAIKYTDGGYIKLNITLADQDNNTARLLFTIEDSGIGIPQSARDTLFDSFTQANSFHKKKHDGVGLGLSIVKSLLQQMKGEINFESEEGVGTRFKVSLPFTIDKIREKKPKQSTDAITKEKITSRHHFIKFNQLKVLIVDDNDVNRLVLKSFLDPYNIPYSEAEDGATALQRLNDEHFDLVLLDINMPGISGIEVHKSYCKGHQERPYFVAVTAHALKKDIDEILNEGFDECLIKPLAEDELIGLLKRFTTKY